MSISKVASPPIEPIDLAQELGPQGVREILEIMWLSYHDMNAAQIVVVGLTENQITEKWFMYLQKRWFSENRATYLRCRLSPVLQHPDLKQAKPKGGEPTIDFCFRTWDPDDRYFGAECKILEAGNGALSQRYINTGIKNYTTGRYGSSCTESAIIGYILKGSISEIVSDICKRLKTEKPIQTLLRDMTFEDPHYKSLHLRTLDSKKIILHHLMFSMTT